MLLRFACELVSLGLYAGLLFTLIVDRYIAGHEGFDERLELLGIKDAGIHLSKERKGHYKVMEEEAKKGEVRIVIAICDGWPRVERPADLGQCIRITKCIELYRKLSSDKLSLQVVCPERGELGMLRSAVFLGCVRGQLGTVKQRSTAYWSVQGRSCWDDGRVR